MGIEFVCPACHDTLRVATDAAGRVVRCGTCLATLRVPAPPADLPPRDDPPPPPRRRDDEYDRPRRRRRPPPRPTGRGPLFWVLVILGLVGLLTVAACGGMFALLQPRWRPYQSPAGGFRVDLPAAPRADMPTLVPVDKRGGPKAAVEGTILVLKREVYAVAYWDITAADRKGVGDDALLEAAVKGMEAEAPAGSRFVRKGKAKVPGCKAEDVAITLPGDDGSVLCRVVVAGPRVFVVMAGGGATPVERNPGPRRFINSFAVTDPQLGQRDPQVGRRDPLGPVVDEVRRQKAAREAVAPPKRRPVPAPEPDDGPGEAVLGPPASKPAVAPPPRPAKPKAGPAFPSHLFGDR